MEKSVVFKLVAVSGLVGIAFVIGRQAALSPVPGAASASTVTPPVIEQPEVATVLQSGISPSARQEREGSGDSSPARVVAPIQPDPQLDLQQATAALDEAIRKQRIYEDDNRQFEVKYQGASAEVLSAAAQLLKKRLEAEQNAIIEDRMKQGLFVESIVLPGDLPPPVKPSKRGGHATIGMRQAPLSDGSMRIRTTEILAEEYPEFDSTRLEYWWLKRKTAGTPVAASAPPSGG